MKLSAVAEPNSSSEPTFARTSSAERRIPRRTSGCSTVFSTATNSTTSTPVITKAPSVRIDVQPADGASTIAQTKTRNAPVTVSAEVQGGADGGQRDLDEGKVEGVEEDDPTEDEEQQLLVPRPGGGVAVLPVKRISHIHLEGHSSRSGSSLSTWMRQIRFNAKLRP
jgi:hypothetical protein